MGVYLHLLTDPPKAKYFTNSISTLYYYNNIKTIKIILCNIIWKLFSVQIISTKYISIDVFFQILTWVHYCSEILWDDFLPFKLLQLKLDILFLFHAFSSSLLPIFYFIFLSLYFSALRLIYPWYYIYV